MHAIKTILASSMEATLVYMDLLLLTLEKIIEFLILTENNKNLSILQEFHKKKLLLCICMMRKSMG